MIAILSFNRCPPEQALIEKGCRWETAARSDEELRFLPISQEEELSPFYEEDRVLDLIYFEIKDASDVERLKLLRKKEPQGLLALGYVWDGAPEI